MKKSLLTLTLAATALTFATSAIAETSTTVSSTTTTTTTMAPVELTFVEMDQNDDYMLGIDEIGTSLFEFYDNDGNEVLDNMEFDNPKVLTVRPVDVEKFTFVDLDNDGVAEQQTYSYEVMWERSGLAMFDDNQDGLAPNEFVGQSFLEMDDNDDKAIDLQEWREAYIMSRAPANAEQERYQD